jgi:predicted ester cyclase
MATTDEATGAAEVARGYFGALGARDRNAQRDWYHADLDGEIYGVVGPAGRDELIAYFDALYAAVPDFQLDVLDLVADGDKAVVRWHVSGTFAGPGRFQGLDPNGARLALTAATS